MLVVCIMNWWTLKQDSMFHCWTRLGHWPEAWPHHLLLQGDSSTVRRIANIVMNRRRKICLGRVPRNVPGMVWRRPGTLPMQAKGNQSLLNARLRGMGGVGGVTMHRPGQRAREQRKEGDRENNRFFSWVSWSLPRRRSSSSSVVTIILVIYVTFCTLCFLPLCKLMPSR